ncbi:predicted protein [Plenodomus lingam JN3]|uniref:Predicted protein n=1 Tax=Leptosphaeria maculans (strain JN3 / isolate v23.1.3 / race Av1-4-5-6-7-8) TaxID=985895 RepID=E5A2V7_LEPMJ|nr:predicted protein [Plenodomus lingam JN3]CBX97903.1 predicted protein [Plenodomus lingam JN3]
MCERLLLLVLLLVLLVLLLTMTMAMTRMMMMMMMLLLLLHFFFFFFFFFFACIFYHHWQDFLLSLSLSRTRVHPEVIRWFLISPPEPNAKLPRRRETFPLSLSLSLAPSLSSQTRSGLVYESWDALSSLLLLSSRLRRWFDAGQKTKQSADWAAGPSVALDPGLQPPRACGAPCQGSDEPWVAAWLGWVMEFYLWQAIILIHNLRQKESGRGKRRREREGGGPVDEAWAVKWVVVLPITQGHQHRCTLDSKQGKVASQPARSSVPLTASRSKLSLSHKSLALSLPQGSRRFVSREAGPIAHCRNIADSSSYIAMLAWGLVVADAASQRERESV